MRKGAMLVGYARVSKADDQDTAAQVKACARPAASESSRRRPPVAAGTGRNFTRPWNSSRKGMCWSFGSSTDFPGL